MTLSPIKDAAPVRIAPIAGADLGPVRDLLRRLQLPAEDVGAPNQTFLAALALAGDELVGCVALERYGADALLRSLAVAPRLQGTGLGRRLYEAIVAEARRTGVTALYLLTTTAAPFFARAGFERIERSEVPAALAGSPEFRSLCPASAACMRLRLG